MATVRMNLALDVDSAQKELTKLNDQFNKGEISQEEYQKRLKSVEKTLVKAKETIDKKTESTKKSRKETDESAQSWLKLAAQVNVYVMAAQTAIKAIQGVVKAVSDMTKSAVEFEKASMNVHTLGVELEQVEKIGDQVREMSLKSGATTEKLWKGVYDTISSGAGDGTTAIQVMDSAIRFSIGASVEADAAVKLLTTSINALGMGAEDSERILNAYQTTIKLGVTTGAELANSLGQVLPAARAAGIGVEEVAAAMVPLTKATGDTNLATTQLGALLSGVRQNVDKLSAAGVQGFNAMTGEIEDMSTFFDSFTSMSGVQIQQIFGSKEAVNAVLALKDTFRTTFEEGFNPEALAGSMNDAFDTMNLTAAQQIERTKRFMDDFQLTAGQALLPLLNFVNNILLDILPDLREVFMEIGGALQTAFGGLEESGTGEQIKTFIREVIEGFRDHILPLIIALITGFKTLFPVIRAVVESGFKYLLDVAKILWTPVDQIIKAFRDFSDGNILQGLKRLGAAILTHLLKPIDLLIAQVNRSLGLLKALGVDVQIPYLGDFALDLLGIHDNAAAVNRQLQDFAKSGELSLDSLKKIREEIEKSTDMSDEQRKIAYEQVDMYEEAVTLLADQAGLTEYIKSLNDENFETESQKTDVLIAQLESKIQELEVQHEANLAAEDQYHIGIKILQTQVESLKLADLEDESIQRLLAKKEEHLRLTEANLALHRSSAAEGEEQLNVYKEQLSALSGLRTRVTERRERRTTITDTTDVSGVDSAAETVVEAIEDTTDDTQRTLEGIHERENAETDRRQREMIEKQEELRDTLSGAFSNLEASQFQSLEEITQAVEKERRQLADDMLRQAEFGGDLAGRDVRNILAELNRLADQNLARLTREFRVLQYDTQLEIINQMSDALVSINDQLQDQLNLHHNTAKVIRGLNDQISNTMSALREMTTGFLDNGEPLLTQTRELMRMVEGVTGAYGLRDTVNALRDLEGAVNRANQTVTEQGIATDIVTPESMERVIMDALGRAMGFQARQAQRQDRGTMRSIEGSTVDMLSLDTALIRRLYSAVHAAAQSSPEILALSRTMMDRFGASPSALAADPDRVQRLMEFLARNFDKLQPILEQFGVDIQSLTDDIVNSASALMERGSALIPFIRAFETPDITPEQRAELARRLSEVDLLTPAQQVVQNIQREIALLEQDTESLTESQVQLGSQMSDYVSSIMEMVDTYQGELLLLETLLENTTDLDERAAIEMAMNQIRTAIETLSGGLNSVPVLLSLTFGESVDAFESTISELEKQLGRGRRLFDTWFTVDESMLQAHKEILDNLDALIESRDQEVAILDENNPEHRERIALLSDELGVLRQRRQEEVVRQQQEVTTSKLITGIRGLNNTLGTTLDTLTKLEKIFSDFENAGQAIGDVFQVVGGVLSQTKSETLSLIGDIVNLVGQALTAIFGRIETRSARRQRETLDSLKDVVSGIDDMMGAYDAHMRIANALTSNLLDTAEKQLEYFRSQGTPETAFIDPTTGREMDLSTMSPEEISALRQGIYDDMVRREREIDTFRTERAKRDETRRIAERAHALDIIDLYIDYEIRSNEILRQVHEYSRNILSLTTRINRAFAEIRNTSEEDLLILDERALKQRFDLIKGQMWAEREGTDELLYSEQERMEMQLEMLEIAQQLLEIDQKRKGESDDQLKLLLKQRQLLKTQAEAGVAGARERLTAVEQDIRDYTPSSTQGASWAERMSESGLIGEVPEDVSESARPNIGLSKSPEEIINDLRDIYSGYRNSMHRYPNLDTWQRLATGHAGVNDYLHGLSEGSIRRFFEGFLGIDIPFFAKGGVMPYDGLAYLHKDEQIIPANQRSNSVNVSFSVVEATNPRQTATVVLDTIKQELKVKHGIQGGLTGLVKEVERGRQ